MRKIILTSGTIAVLLTSCAAQPAESANAESASRQPSLPDAPYSVAQAATVLERLGDELQATVRAWTANDPAHAVLATLVVDIRIADALLGAPTAQTPPPLASRDLPPLTTAVTALSTMHRLVSALHQRLLELDPLAAPWVDRTLATTHTALLIQLARVAQGDARQPLTNAPFGAIVRAILTHQSGPSVTEPTDVSALDQILHEPRDDEPARQLAEAIRAALRTAQATAHQGPPGDDTRTRLRALSTPLTQPVL